MSGTAACASPKALLPGDYQQTAGPDVVLFVSKQLLLFPDQHFEYYRYTDVGAGKQYGTGTYRQRGRWLRLHFDNRPLAAHLSAWQRPLSPDPDSLLITFRIRGGGGADSLRPVEGATVIFRDAAGRVLLTASAGKAGRIERPFAQSPPPRFVEVISFGFTSWLQLWPEQPSALTVQLAPKLGWPVPAGTSWGFRQLPAPPGQLRLRWGADTVRFLRPPLP